MSIFDKPKKRKRKSNSVNMAPKDPLAAPSTAKPNRTKQWLDEQPKPVQTKPMKLKKKK